MPATYKQSKNKQVNSNIVCRCCVDNDATGTMKNGIDARNQCGQQ